MVLVLVLVLILVLVGLVLVVLILVLVLVLVPLLLSRTAVADGLLYTRVDAAAALRLESGVIGECDLECIGGTDAGARAGVQPRRLREQVRD